MKIFIFLFFIFNSFIFADKLLSYKYDNNKYYTYCIKNYSIQNNRLYYKKSNSWFNSSVPFTRIKSYSIKDGYSYSYNTGCVIADNQTENYTPSTNDNELSNKTLYALGLTDNDLNLMFAISGLMTSFLFLFGLFRFI